MESDLCPFNRLPGSMCAAFLQQAFRQLDQQHLYGIAPLVCRAWHQAALSSSDTLDLVVAAPAKAEQLEPWMQRHGALFSKRVTLTLQYPEKLENRWRLASPLYNSLSEQLRELRLEGNWLVEKGLSALTSLTSLCLPGGHIWGSDRYALLALTQLRTLDLPGTHLMHQLLQSFGYSSDTGFLTAMSTSLVELTRLNLNKALWVGNENFSALRALPHLCELEAGGLFDIRAARLSCEFTGLPLTSISISVWDQEDLGELKAWLQQAGPGSQLSPLSCLESLDLHGLRLPTASLGMESWASKLVQLTELVISRESEGEVRQAFGARFSHRQVKSRVFVLRPLGGP